ncbi:MAG: hypothetical protein HYU53_13440 [Acidobacteria bacterium]|nr:hypothetical protein [Acidobacteriota bacterium]
MKAIAVHPGRAGSIHPADLDPPSLDGSPGGQGVLARVLMMRLLNEDTGPIKIDVQVAGA